MNSSTTSLQSHMNADAGIAKADSNNTNTASRQALQIGVSITFLALTIPAVMLRIWVRKWMINSFGVDDYMMLVALFSFLIYNAALMEIVANGGGTHIQTFSSLKIALDWLIVNEVFYLVTQIFLKLSLGYFFLRVVISRGQRRFIYGTIIFSTLINTAHIFFVILRCGDPHRIAENTLANRCVSSRVTLVMSYWQASVSTVTDMIFAVMPIPLLWNATMDLRSKVSAGFILSLGAFGSICSIVRFLYVQSLALQTDFFWSAVNISLWSNIELGTGIIAGSLATLRPLLKRVIRSTRNHLTLAATKAADKRHHPSFKSTISKPLPALTDLTSVPSVFQTWESATGDKNGYTASCVGGSLLPRSTRVGSRAPTDILASTDYNRADIWPFTEDSRGICKITDFSVSITNAEPQSNRDIDAERHPLRQHKVVLQGGGHWGVRKEDQIKQQSRSAPATTLDLGRSSTPEWEKLPDLILPENLKRHSVDDGGKAGPSGLKSKQSSPHNSQRI